MNIRQEYFRNPVIVLGNSSANSLGVIRAYGRKGIPVYFIHTDREKTASKSSKYLSKRIRIEEWSPHYLGLALVSLLDELSGIDKTVVIPTNDASLIVYSSLKPTLSDIFIDCLPPYHLIKLFVNKQKFYNLLRERNIPHPKTYDLKNVIDAGKMIKYPFALKPLYSYEFEKAFEGKKLFKVESRKDLDMFLNLNKKNIGLLVQEIIPGDDIYIVCFYVTKRFEIPVVCGYHKVRQFQPEFGTASMVETSWNEELINNTIRIVKELGYTGIGEAEYKYDPRDGQYKLFEINVRSTNQNRLVPHLGADLEMLYYLEALQHRVPKKISVNQSPGLKWMDFQKDIRSLCYRDKKIGFSYHQWLKSYRNVIVDGYFATDDLKPFFVELIALLKSGIKRGLKIAK